MSVWQWVRLVTVVLIEGIGYLFLLWAIYLQYQSVTNSVEEPNIFGIWLGIIFCFFFLVVGLLCVRTIKKHISEKLLFWLTKPALILSITLFSLYLLFIISVSLVN